MIMVAWVLYAMLGSDVSGLGHDSYAVRENSQQRLEQFWPFSRAAILNAGQSSPDPEIRQRAAWAEANGAERLFGKWGRVVRGIMDRPESESRLMWLMDVQPQLVRWEMVDFALEDKTGHQMFALWVLVAPFPELSGLPYLDTAHHRKYGRYKKLRQAMCDLVGHTWMHSDGTAVLLGCDPRFDTTIGQNQNLHGADDARMWVRGMPNPYAWPRPKGIQYWADFWAKCRMKGLPEPKPPVELPEPE